jgi:hypothetical protein
MGSVDRGDFHASPDGDGLCTGVVLLVVRAGLASDRGVAGGEHFVFAQPGERRDQVEHLDHLGAEAAGVAGAVAERVLTGDARPCL